MILALDVAETTNFLVGPNSKECQMTLRTALRKGLVSENLLAKWADHKGVSVKQIMRRDMIGPATVFAGLLSLLVSLSSILWTYLTKTENFLFGITFFVSLFVSLILFLVSVRLLELTREFMADHDELWKFLAVKPYATNRPNSMRNWKERALRNIAIHILSHECEIEAKVGQGYFEGLSINLHYRQLHKDQLESAVRLLEKFGLLEGGDKQRAFDAAKSTFKQT